MPLQNRVAPDGTLHAVAARGTMLGNRGGKFHRDDKTIGKRRWASHHWICCELHYKSMHHEPMGRGYTSLFFLDEVTALSAGHRPCFFCRRKEAEAFLAGEKVEGFDRRVHIERVAGKGTSPTASRFPLSGGEGTVASSLEKLSPKATDEVPVPDATMIGMDGHFFAKRGSHFLRWSFEGYDAALDIHDAMRFRVLTPPSITAILARGYQPRWHASALQWEDT
jgi:hypothetical protein